MKKKIMFKITNNNVDLFCRLGNIFPEIQILENLYNKFSSNFTDLLNDITNNDIDNFFIQYLSKSRLKTLSNFSIMNIETYGLDKYNDFYLPKNETYSNLAKLIENRYYLKWKKLWDTFSLKYNPIRPYDMEIKDKSKETTKNDFSLKRESDYVGNDKNIDIVKNDTTDNSYYGFNSIKPQPSDISNNNSNSESSGNSTSNTKAKTDTLQNKDITNDRDIVRLGNIGNITQQELIERERDLWEYQIYDVLFNDLNRVLTRSKYI